jgi:hypothetical protein
MGNQSASRLEGDRYQHLYSWYELLELLNPETAYNYGYVEHPEAGAADDVTLHHSPGVAGPSKFVQVKFHVDHRHMYSFNTFLEVLTGKRCLLEKLFDSWKKLRTNGPVEVWLVSNWAMMEELGAYVRGRDGTFKEEFHQCEATSVAGIASRRWIETL